MRPEEHPLWTEYRPVSAKVALTGAFFGVVGCFAVLFWAMSV